MPCVVSGLCAIESHTWITPCAKADGICRTCCRPIWWEIGQVGHQERTGWSDRIKQGGDSLVCFNAVGYRHVPLEGRELAIYKAGYRQAVEDNA